MFLDHKSSPFGEETIAMRPRLPGKNRKCMQRDTYLTVDSFNEGAPSFARFGEARIVHVCQKMGNCDVETGLDARLVTKAASPISLQRALNLSGCKAG